MKTNNFRAKYLILLNSSNKISNFWCGSNYFSTSQAWWNSEKDSSSTESSASRKRGIFKVFQDEESPVILDVEEERASFSSSLTTKNRVEPWDEFCGLNLNRGVNGVFEILDLVDVLTKNRAKNIFVAKVPTEVNYVDYLVVVTCTSRRHIFALTQFVLKVYKRKRYEEDPIPPVVGENTSDWVALDLGNIALHMMTEPTREKYDLETLWSIGTKFDDLSVKSENTILEILQRHSVTLDDFKPANQLR